MFSAMAGVLALLGVLAISSNPVSVRPAPGWPFPLPATLTVSGKVIRLDSTGRGSASRLPEPGNGAFRWLVPKDSKNSIYYFPSSYQRVRVKSAAMGTTILAALAGEKWEPYSRIRPVSVREASGPSLELVLPPGDWKIAVLRRMYVPALIGRLRVLKADVSVSPPQRVSRAGGVDAIPVDPRSGRPPAHWKAFATKTDRAAAESDAAFFRDVPIGEDGGRLDFESLPVGTWEIRFEAPGYVATRKTFSVKAGTIVHLGTVPLSTGGDLSLVVNFPDEVPEGKIDVALHHGPARVARRAPPFIERNLDAKSSLTADFTDLEPGLLTVIIEQRGSGLFAEAEVAIEEARRATATMTLTPIHISGTVWRGKDPLPDCRIAIRGHGTTPLADTTAGEDATYGLRVWVPGQYGLTTTPPDSALPFPEIVTIPEDTPEVTHDIHLPSGRVAGTIRDAETGKGIARAEVDSESAASPDGSVDSASVSLHAEADAEGDFVLDNLTLAPVDITAGARGYEQKVTKGVSPTEDGGHLEILLEPSAGLRGVVTDGSGAPVAMALVGVDYDESGETFSQETTSGPDGSFEFDSIGAGSHVLFAFACGHTLAIVPAEVPATQGPTTVVLPSSLSGLRLHFEDAGHRPVADQMVTLVVNGVRLPRIYPFRFSSMCGERPRSDADGNLDLSMIPLGMLQGFTFPDGAALGSFRNDRPGLTWNALAPSRKGPNP